MAAPTEKKEILVFISGRNSVCGECHSELGKKAWVTLAGEKGALCLVCADLDHLTFLPSGNVALTRRPKKHSSLSAVVLKWSSTRKRYERQGLLVEEEALHQAESECLADEEARELQRGRAAERREHEDKGFIEQFESRLRELYPEMPPGRENAIAAHACQKYSGRVGRSSSAKELQEDAVRLAVIAHIRHTETDYDALLMDGGDRQDARSRVREKVDGVLKSWQGVL